jgi:hypothetical protein
LPNMYLCSWWCHLVTVLKRFWSCVSNFVQHTIHSALSYRCIGTEVMFHRVEQNSSCHCNSWCLPATVWITTCQELCETEFKKLLQTVDNDMLQCWRSDPEYCFGVVSVASWVHVKCV